MRHERHDKRPVILKLPTAFSINNKADISRYKYMKYNDIYEYYMLKTFRF